MSVDERFPNMTPISGPPPLFRLNGCGVGVYGTRDRDEKTNTYITTYCISVVWFPVFPLCAYRISDAPSGGWYFLGKEPLSLFARAWRGLVALLVGCTIAAGVYDTHFNSPEKRQERALASARAHIAADRTLVGARELARLTGGNTDAATSARHELSALITRELDRVKLKDVAPLIKLAAAGVQKNVLPGLDAAGLYKRGEAVLARATASEPRTAIAIAEALTPLAPDAGAHRHRRETLLRQLHDKNKGDVEIAVGLAKLIEESGEPARMLPVLEPHAKVLKGEGLRLLGGAYGATGRLVEAIAILDAEVQPRLYGLRETSRQYAAARKEATEQVFADLKKGRAPRSLLKDIEHGDSQETKKALISGYLRQRLANEPYVQTTLAGFREALTVIPVVLTLGELRLRRAAQVSDPAERKAQFEAAEKLFESVRDEAEDVDAYQLYAGQVRFWLGRPAEGQKYFDALLAKNNRAPATLAQVARTLRQVGDATQARALAEEAYKSEKDRKLRENLAETIASLTPSGPEQLTWLERAGDGPDARASLALARGRSAAHAGKTPEAVVELGRAASLYDGMKKSPESLCNAAAAGFELAELTGDEATFTAAVGRVEEAFKLRPSDSRVLEHAAVRQLDLGLRQVFPAGLMPQASESTPSLEHLSMLYADQKSREAAAARLMANASIKLAVQRHEQLAMISPQDPASYRALAALYLLAGDVPALQSLVTRFSAASATTSTQSEMSKDRRAGKLDAQIRQIFQPRTIRLLAALSSGTLDASPMSFAMATRQLMSAHLTLASTGDRLPSDALLPICEKAMSLLPSWGTFVSWREIVAWRAVDRLSVASPEAAKLAAALRRDLPCSSQLLLILWKVPALKSHIKSDAELARWFSVWRERSDALPGLGWGYDAMVRWLVDPADGKRKLAAVRADAANRVDKQLSLELDRNDVNRCISEVLTSLIDRGEESAAAGFAEAGKRGVALPAGL